MPRADVPDVPLLTQWAVVRPGGWLGSRTGALFLQHFEWPESWDWFHRHRWARTRSWVLSGWWLEERAVVWQGWVHSQWRVLRQRGDSYRMSRRTIHRVDAWSHDCWTLFWMSPDHSDDWGYYRRNGRESDFVPWRQFVQRRVPNLETGDLTQ